MNICLNLLWFWKHSIFFIWQFLFILSLFLSVILSFICFPFFGQELMNRKKKQKKKKRTSSSLLWIYSVLCWVCYIKMYLNFFNQLCLQLFTSEIPNGCWRLVSCIECCSDHALDLFWKIRIVQNVFLQYVQSVLTVSRLDGEGPSWIEELWPLCGCSGNQQSPGRQHGAGTERWWLLILHCPGLAAPSPIASVAQSCQLLHSKTYCNCVITASTEGQSCLGTQWGFYHFTSRSSYWPLSFEKESNFYFLLS